MGILFYSSYPYWLNISIAFPRVYKCISRDKELYVELTFQGFSIPLPDWFCIGHNTVNRFSMPENFVSHIKNRFDLFSIMLSELNSMQQTAINKPQGRPKYSSSVIHYALLLRFMSWQSYKWLLQQFPLPLLPLLKKDNIRFYWLSKSCKAVIGERSYVRRLCTSCQWNVFAKFSTVSQWQFCRTKWRGDPVQGNSCVYDRVFKKVYSVGS